jgi:hypothetical protein
MSEGSSGCLGLFFGSSWRLSDKIFAPCNCFLGEEDDEMRWLYALRSAIATVIIFCVAIRYHHLKGFSETLGTVNQSISWTLQFTFLSIIPTGGIIVLYTKPNKRWEAVRQLKYPATAFGGWLCIMYGYPLLQRWLSQPRDDPALGLPLAIIGLIEVVWFGSFMVRTFYLSVTGLFRLGDGHPLLPPSVTMLAAWALGIRGLVAGSGDTAEPATLTTILLIGGPISLTLLAVLEVERLKRNYPDDFPFRNGPLLPIANSR